MFETFLGVLELGGVQLKLCLLSSLAAWASYAFFRWTIQRRVPEQASMILGEQEWAECALCPLLEEGLAKLAKQLKRGWHRWKEEKYGRVV